SVLAATPLGLAHIRSNRLPVRSESRLRFTAPVRSRVVVVVERFVTRIRHLADVHRFVADVQAVRAEHNLGRPKELTHKSFFCVLDSKFRILNYKSQIFSTG